MVLACNDPAAADDLLSRWRPARQPDLALRCFRMARREVATHHRNSARERDAQDDPA
jgi:hypothetical protein